MLRGVREYVRAGSVEEAVRFLGQNGPRTSLLAGGTDLLFVDKAYDTILDISRLDLDYIREENDALVIGAMSSIETISRSETVGAYADGMLCDACHLFGTYQIRNMATLGGNVANAMPAADPPSALLALDADVVAAGPGGKSRRIPIAEFFRGPRRTVLEKSELITELRVPRVFRDWRGRWKKIGRVVRDIALVNCGVSARFDGARVEDVRIALCAVAPKPIRIPEAESMVRGESLTADLLSKVQAEVGRRVAPISDVRASEAYRRHVSGVLVRRALAEAAGLAEGA